MKLTDEEESALLRHWFSCNSDDEVRSALVGLINAIDSCDKIEDIYDTFEYRMAKSVIS